MGCWTKVKKGLKIQLVKDIKIFLEKKKKKSSNMDEIDIKNFLKTKKRSWLNIRKL